MGLTVPKKFTCAIRNHLKYSLMKIDVFPIINLILGSCTKILNNHFSSHKYSVLRSETNNYCNSKELFSNTKFESDFIWPNLMEKYFYLETGIKANEKSIYKLISFKDKLGGNYTWRKIKLVQNYLSFEKSDIEIKITKLEKLQSLIGVILSLMLVLTSIFGASYFSQFEILELRDILIYGMIISVPFGVGYFIISHVNSIIIATQMNKKLKTKIQSKN